MVQLGGVLHPPPPLFWAPCLPRGVRCAFRTGSPVFLPLSTCTRLSCPPSQRSITCCHSPHAGPSRVGVPPLAVATALGRRCWMTDVLVPTLLVSLVPLDFPQWTLGKGIVKQIPPLLVSFLRHWGIPPHLLRQSPPIPSVHVPSSATPPSLSSSHNPFLRLRRCWLPLCVSPRLWGGPPPILPGPAYHSNIKVRRPNVMLNHIV